TPTSSSNSPPGISPPGDSSSRRPAAWSPPAAASRSRWPGPASSPPTAGCTMRCSQWWRVGSGEWGAGRAPDRAEVSRGCQSTGHLCRTRISVLVLTPHSPPLTPHRSERSERLQQRLGQLHKLQHSLHGLDEPRDPGSPGLDQGGGGVARLVEDLPILIEDEQDRLALGRYTELEPESFRLIVLLQGGPAVGGDGDPGARLPLGIERAP